MPKQTKNTDYRYEFFDNSEMLISLYDQNLNLIDANHAFLEVLNLNKDEILGKNISIISPDCIPSGRYKIYENIIKNGGRYVSDQVKLHPSLGGIFIRLSAFKVGSGLGISSKDITSLVETVDDLETFIYKTSHDVRAPIATILGLVNVAGLDDKLDTSAKFYLKSIQQQSELLDVIVRRLTDTVSIRTSAMVILPIDVNKKIERVLTAVSELKKFKNITIHQEIQADISLNSDHRLLFTILNNILTNAVKFIDLSKPTPTIDIRVSQDSFGVRFLISDNGIGIEERFVKDAFKMFFRGTNFTDGVGLGLFHTKQYVKKLGGRIQLYSQLGLGTCVEIFLPHAITVSR